MNVDCISQCLRWIFVEEKNDETLKGLALELHQKHQEKVHFLGLLTHIFET